MHRLEVENKSIYDLIKSKTFLDEKIRDAVFLYMKNIIHHNNLFSIFDKINIENKSELSKAVEAIDDNYFLESEAGNMNNTLRYFRLARFGNSLLFLENNGIDNCYDSIYELIHSSENQEETKNELIEIISKIY